LIVLLSEVVGMLPLMPLPPPKSMISTLTGNSPSWA